MRPIGQQRLVVLWGILLLEGLASRLSGSAAAGCRRCLSEARDPNFPSIAVSSKHHFAQFAGKDRMNRGKKESDQLDAT